MPRPDYSAYDGYLAPEDDEPPCRRCGWTDDKKCEDCAAARVDRTVQTIRRWVKQGWIKPIDLTVELIGYPLYAVADLVKCERDTRHAWPEGTGPAREAAAERRRDIG